MNKNNNKLGFTLIELLAVIIILGVIMLIAIPSVTSVISDSRKETYIDTVKEYVKGATILVNSGEEISFYDKNATMYIPTTCIPTESGGKSPFGEFEPGYVVVIYTGNGYKYYWTGRDTANMGIYLSDADKLTKKLIQTGVKEIDNTIGVGDRERIILINDTCRSAGIDSTPASFTATEDVVATSMDDIKPGVAATAKMNLNWFTNSGIERNQVKSIAVVNHQNIPTDATSWDCGTDVKCWKIADGDLYKLYIGAEKGVLAPANSISLFEGYTNATSMDLRFLNTKNVTDMSNMFYNCKKLANLNISSFNTSKVTRMRGMFNYCLELTTLDLRSFNTSKVTDMYGMFKGAGTNVEYHMNLQHIYGLEKFDTSKVTNMGSMFAYCSNLYELDISSFNTSKVTDMSDMFHGWFKGNKKITSLDITHFDTSKVKNMNGMFSWNTSLKEINLIGIDTSKVTDMSNMFFYDNQLTTVYVNESFVTTSVTSGGRMFEGCNKIKGSNGTTYNKNNISSTYARIDRPGTPGYFSELIIN